MMFGDSIQVRQSLGLLRNTDYANEPTHSDLADFICSKEKLLRTLHHTQPECLTAFRLPKPLLETLNAICAELDCNRSQLIRRSLKEFIAFHELDRRKQDFHHQQIS
jgi:hypothetical protein